MDLNVGLFEWHVIRKTRTLDGGGFMDSNNAPVSSHAGA